MPASASRFMPPLRTLGAQTQARLTLDLGTGAPPREFRIFSKGAFKSLNQGSGGRDEFVFTDDSAKTVLAKAAKKGTDYAIDYEHQSVNTYGRAPAAGYFKLSVRNGELWASDVEWTAQGAADLTSGTGPQGQRTPPQYRYFSPVFNYDAKTGVITELLNLGLTNMPATRDMRPLAASYRPRPPLGAQRPLSINTPRAKPTAAPAHQEHQMSDKKLARAATSTAFTTVQQAHEIATASLRESNDALSASNTELRAKLNESTASTSTANSVIKAKDEEIAALKATAKEVASIVDKETLVEARGVFVALKAEVAKVADLTAKVAKIESDAKVAKLSELVEKGLADGKITPAEKDAFLKADLSFVETILAVRPPVAQMSDKGGTAQQKPITAGASVDLAPDLLAVAKEMGWDAAKIQASVANRV